MTSHLLVQRATSSRGSHLGARARARWASAIALLGLLAGGLARSAEVPTAGAPKAVDRKGSPAPERFASDDALQPEELEREAKAARKRDAQIEALKRIVPRAAPGSSQKAEMLFQLSELYWEKSRALYRMEMLAYFTAQKAASEKARAGVPTEEAKEDHRESELYRAETMRLDEEVLREHPTYERKDEVLFNLAYNLYEIGQREVAVGRYKELLRDHPTSKFVPDALVQLGNHAFEVANALDEARGYYERAWQTTNPKIQSYALYKLAWCDFNAGQPERALEKLQATIAFSEKQGKDRAFTDLKSEALHDTVRVYVELDRPDDAVAYYRAHAHPSRQAALTAKLADGLLEAGHQASAVGVYRQLLKEAPLAASAPEYQRAIVKAFEALRQRERVREEMQRLAESYRPGSAWWDAHAGSEAVLRAGFELAEEALRTAVTEYHHEAQKTKDAETYRLARDLYRQYLDAFASSADPRYVSDHAFNLKFYYGEILWALEEWEAAARQYEEVVAFTVPPRPTAKELANERYRQEASYDAILAYEKLVKIERGRLKATALKDDQHVEEAKRKGSVERWGRLERRAGAALEEQPLTPFERALVAACDRHNERYPGHRDEVDVAYQAALLYYQRNHFVEAAKRFAAIIDRHPEERRSQEAAELSMGVLEEKREWAALNTLARKLAANTRLARPGSDFARRLAGIVEGSQYQLIDEVVYRQRGDLPLAQAQFLAFVEEFPRSDNADRALTYAMMIAEEQGARDTAVRLGERLLEDYPLSPLDLRVKYDLARLLEATGRFGLAATRYEDFVATYDAATGGSPGVGKSRDTKRTAGAGKSPPTVVTVRLEALKDAGRRADREALLRRCVDPSDHWVRNALYNAGLWYEATGALEQAVAAKERYLARFPDASDVERVAEELELVLVRAGRLDEALGGLERRLRAAVGAPARWLELKERQLDVEERRARGGAVERVAKELVTAWPRLTEAERGDARARRAAAHARLTLLEPAFRAYGTMQFKRLASFKSDRVAKERKLVELESAYAEVLTLGDPTYAIAALTRMGQLYADFAQCVSALPDPPGLDEEQLALFRSELESRFVLPVEQKAIEALEKALGKAFELSVYGPWTLEAQAALERFRPGRYAPVRGPSPSAADPLVAEVERLEGALAQSQDPGQELGNQLSAAYRRAGRLDDAEAAARRVLDRGPRSAAALQNLSLVALDRSNWRLAELLAAEAARLDQKDPRPQELLGLAALGRGDVDRAQALFRRALALDERFSPAWKNLGQVALRFRDFEGAERAFRKVLALEGERPEALLALASALEGLRRADPHRGTEQGAILERVLAQRPDDADALCGAGWAFSSERSTWPKAIGYLERCRAAASSSVADRAAIDAKLQGLAALTASDPGARPPPARVKSDVADGGSIVDRVSEEGAVEAR